MYEARKKVHNKIIVGDCCLKETPYSEVAFWLRRDSGNRILQPNHFIYNQTNSLSFAFIPRKRSEWAHGYSPDWKASNYSNSMVQSKVKVHPILSQARDIIG